MDAQYFRMRRCAVQRGGQNDHLLNLLFPHLRALRPSPPRDEENPEVLFVTEPPEKHREGVKVVLLGDQGRRTELLAARLRAARTFDEVFFVDQEGARAREKLRALLLVEV